MPGVYVIAAWPGPRHYGCAMAEQHRGFYIRRQHHMLRTIAHRLELVILVEQPIETPDPDFHAAIRELVQDTEIGCDVVHLVNPSNAGYSYGAFAHAYHTWAAHVDVTTPWFLQEDDYTFALHYWDTLLWQELQTRPDVGHLCSYYHDAHAAHFAGIHRGEALSALMLAHGRLPVISSVYKPAACDTQALWAHHLRGVGWQTADYAARWRSEFHPGKIFGAAHLPILVTASQLHSDASMLPYWARGHAS